MFNTDSTISLVYIKIRKNPAPWWVYARKKNRSHVLRKHGTLTRRKAQSSRLNTFRTTKRGSHSQKSTPHQPAPRISESNKFACLSAYLSLPWPADAPPPKLELHACLALMCAGVLLLPILMAVAFFKLGNLANDGIKLGRNLSICSRDPTSSLHAASSDSGEYGGYF